MIEGGDPDDIQRPNEDRHEVPPDFAAVWARHEKELYLYLVGLLRRRDIAADLLQNISVKVLTHLPAGGPAHHRAWLFRVAHNEAIDWQRRQVRESGALQQVAWWHQTEDFSPSQTLEQQETIGRLREAVTKLPVEQQHVVQLRIHEDKTFAEIAQLLNLPLGTVLTRMRLATERLAHLMRDEIEP